MAVTATAEIIAADQSLAAHGDAAHNEGHGGHAEVWPDLTKKEALTLFPLAVATIVFGVYPKPIFDIAEPAFERILRPFL